MDLSLSKLQEAVKAREAGGCSPRGHKESDATERLINNSTGTSVITEVGSEQAAGHGREEQSLPR